MKKTGVFYGSNTGTTRNIAYRIAKALGVDAADVHDVAQTAPSAVGGYDVLVLGTSTWRDGEPEDDWYDFLDGLDELDLRGKEAALFGCGDETMSESFNSGVGRLRKRLEKTGIRFIAPYNVTGYHFDRSDAIGENEVEACGLLLDEVNHPELTDARIAGWAETVKAAE